MGVQGLFTFIENNSKIYRNRDFCNSKLVIDGCNLYHLLYHNLELGLEQNHGGEYDAFEGVITKFVKALRDCGIQPYFILDGGADCSNKKYDTLRKRAEERIRKAQNAAMGGNEKILPILVNMVVKQTLTNLKVPFAQCFGEADLQIASLAREWRCPVLSNDSDFYVFDLPGGFLPISHFKWNEVSQSKAGESYIPCKYYRASCFDANFGIKLQLLPLMAALNGNDYVKLREMGISLRWTEYSTPGKESMSRLDGIVQWLKNFQSPDDALEAVLRLMGDLSRQKEAEVREALILGMKEYQFPPACLLGFFNNGTVPNLEPEAVGIVPDWARLPLTQGRLTSDILDVLLLRRQVQPCQVDHADRPSANITSRPIRQVMYGLLLGCDTGSRVEEWDRDGTQLAKIMVKPIASKTKSALDLLHQAGQSVHQQVFLEALGVTHNTLSGVPSNLCLPVAVTCYWLQHSSPPPDEKLIQALLLGIVAGQQDTMGKMKMDIPVHEQPKQEFDVTHAYNEWQVCLKDSINLNQLLCFPLQEPQIAGLYKGTLVHYLVHRLREGVDPELLLQEETRRQLYKDLLTTVLQSQDKTRKKGAATQRHQPVDDLAVRFNALQLLEDLEKESNTVIQEEYPDRDSVSVKTRYKAKDRVQRCKNQELTRKCGCIDRDFSMRPQIR